MSFFGAYFEFCFAGFVMVCAVLGYDWVVHWTSMHGRLPDGYVFNTFVWPIVVPAILALGALALARKITGTRVPAGLLLLLWGFLSLVNIFAVSCNLAYGLPFERCT